MREKDRAWEVDLTPARVSGRRATGRPVTASAPDAAQYGDLVEAINKIADQLSRLEAKIEVIEEHLAALTRNRPRSQPSAGSTDPDDDDDEARRAAAPLAEVGAEIDRLRRRLQDAAVKPPARQRQNRRSTTRAQPPR